MNHDGDFQREKRRKLSPAEAKRLERFEEVSAQLVSDGYRKTELTVGIVRANIFAILLAIPLCIVAITAFALLNPDATFFTDGTNMIVVLVAYIGLIVVHELIHGITWSLYAPNRWHDIDFGFMKEYLTPYCTCATPLPKGSYILGALMPLIVLGIIPCALGIAIGSVTLLFIGILMIVSAGGDILIVIELLRYRSDAAEQLIYDHPTQAGCVLFERLQ